MKDSDLIKKLKKQVYKKGRFVLSSGKISNYYLDKYLFETNPLLLKEVAKRLSKILPNKKPIAVVELGGVALGAAISLEKNVKFLIVRRGEKKYGTNKKIEGSCKNVKDVIIVEDIVMTGKSLLFAKKILNDSGIRVTGCVAVIFRGDKKTENGLKKIFPFHYLLRADEIIRRSNKRK